MTKLTEIHAAVDARLRLDGQRYTAGRRDLVELLATAPHPPAIAEITAALPELPRSTAYRNLVDLERAGLVRRVSTTDEFARFELTEELTEHHHHLVCVSCGRVLDVDADASVERAVARTVERVAARHGFTPIDHRLDVLGHCRTCRRTAVRAPRQPT